MKYQISTARETANVHVFTSLDMAHTAAQMVADRYQTVATVKAIDLDRGFIGQVILTLEPMPR